MWALRPAHRVGMTTTEQNKQIVSEFISALFTDGDVTAVDRYLDPGFTNHDAPMPGLPDGRDGMRTAAEMFRKAFPDWRAEVRHLVAEGDLVAEHFTASGTHQGSVMGEAPTGGEIRLHGMQIFRIAGGKIVERWGVLDQLSLLQQLGLAG